MDLSVTKTGQNAFVVALGEKRAGLNGKDMKKLLVQSVEILMPEAIKLAPRPEDLRFRINHANIVGVRTFLKSVDRAAQGNRRRTRPIGQDQTAADNGRAGV